MNRHATTERRPATYQDVLDAREHMVAELIEGALHLQPRPASPPCARQHRLLAYEIGGPFDQGRGGPGGWWILDEPELHLGPDVLVPDLAGWRRERMPSPPRRALVRARARLGLRGAEPGHPRASTSPTSAASTLAPASRTSGSSTRPPAPSRPSRSRDGAWTLVAALKDDEEVRVPPFDAIAFPLSALWPD